MSKKKMVSKAINRYTRLYNNMINDYIEKEDKRNNFVELGECEDELDALKKATEMIFEKYPYLPKKLIYTQMIEPDLEDFTPESGETFFTYTVDEEMGFFMFFSFMNCKNCKHCKTSENFHECFCKVHQKKVWAFDEFCENYHPIPNYFQNNFSNDLPQNPYI